MKEKIPLKISPLTTLMIICYCMGTIIIPASAQTNQTVTLQQNAIKIADVFIQIRKQTGFIAMYDNLLLDAERKTNVNFHNTPVSQVLDQILEGRELMWTVSGKNILIQKKNQVSGNGLSAGSVNSQQQPITGRIVDSTETGIRGVTIRILDAKTGTFTDGEGRFSLAVNEGDVVSVSAVGYLGLKFRIGPERKAVFLSFEQPAAVGVNKSYQDNPKERATGSFVQNTDKGLLIVLLPKISYLDEINIVSTGYEIFNPDKATGSFSVINKELFNRRVSGDVISKLEGVVPGLLFNKNTTTTSLRGIDINIRGHSTLFSNDQPLIVVDGFPYSGDINNINPITVESISILKDAAAASIWGVKSGNGVIVITTKKGLRNKNLVVELNSNITIGEKPNIFYNKNFLDSKDFITIERDLFERGYYNRRINDPYLVVSPVVQTLSDAKKGIISTAEAETTIGQYVNNDVRNDISRYFYQKSINQQYALALNGGNNNSDYFLSLGFDKDRLNLTGNSGNRISLNTLYNYYRDS